MPKAKFCVIVPAFNEERVIEPSLKSLKKMVLRDHIYVVSDGSKDDTVKIAKRNHANVLALRKNYGKANAIFKLIKKFDLNDRYKYILFSDADSRLGQDFIKQINSTISQKPACIVGTVTSDRYGLISAYRTYEYLLTHKIYKNAQNNIGVITVAPGCAALYRSDVLKQLDFSHNTLTEDFDLTLQIHEKKLGKIIYVPKAEVITQDPPTLLDYWNQVLRWYTGFWQNILLHRLYLPTRKINFEIYLLVVDALFLVVALALAIAEPRLFLKMATIMFLAMYLSSTFILLIYRKWWALIFVPLFPIFSALNLTAYFLGLCRAVFIRQNLLWNKVRRYRI